MEDIFKDKTMAQTQADIIRELIKVKKLEKNKILDKLSQEFLVKVKTYITENAEKIKSSFIIHEAYSFSIYTVVDWEYRFDMMNYFNSKKYEFEGFGLTIKEFNCNYPVVILSL